MIVDVAQAYAVLGDQAQASKTLARTMEIADDVNVESVFLHADQIELKLYDEAYATSRRLMLMEFKADALSLLAVAIARQEADRMNSGEKI